MMKVIHQEMEIIKMTKYWKWFAGIALGLVLLFGGYLLWLVFPVIGNGYGMMGGGHRLIGGFGLPLVGMGLMWIIPVGVFVLLLIGAAWLGRKSLGQKITPGSMCPACGQEIQAEWTTCPHCATALI